MKKFWLFMIAAVMAIGFSSFTTEKKSTDTYYYWDGDTFEIYTLYFLCEGVGMDICRKPKPNEPETLVEIYDSPNPFDYHLYHAD